MAESQNIDPNGVAKTVNVKETITNDVTNRTLSERGFCSSFCSPNRQRKIGKIFYTIGVGVWLFGLLFGIYGAIRVSLSTWRHYKESPTVISMDRDYKDWNTSFPAIMICPLEKYDNDSLNELVDILPYEDKLELRKFLVALSGATYDTFDLVPEFPEIDPSQYLELLLKTKFKFSYTLSGSSSEANSVGYLTPTIIERGLCYAFNSDILLFITLPNRLPICDVQGMHCLAQDKDVLSSLRYNNGKKVSCNCLPSCNNVNYVIETDHSIPWFLGTNLKWGMTVYPKMRLRRDILFTFNDVLISVGSSIGLFLGCSLLSLVQVTYFVCSCLCRGIRKMFKTCFGCVKIHILRGKHRYLPSASSGRSAEPPPPLPDEYVPGNIKSGGLNPTFVAQHI